MRRFLSLAAIAALAGGCGPQAGTAGDSPIQRTLDYIRANGFPRLADLLPPLPAQLARIPGVETSEAGLPAVPDDLGGASFSNMTALTAEAQQLAAQGFSEARRLEASVLNLAAPIHNLLGRGDLFTRTGAAGGGDGGSGGAMMMTESGSSASGLFDQLLQASEFAVDAGGKDGLPHFLVLGVHTATSSIDISGLWAVDGATDQFKTGFHARVRLAAADDLAVTFTLTPGSLAGLVPGWSATSCPDDVWQVGLAATPEGERRLEVTTRECPSERDAVSTMSFARTADGPWQLVGGFAQSFPGATGLRGFLGARQGFVVQAAADGEMARLAAAAAVLGESDFAAPSQEKVDAFGVGQLLARYFEESYWKPRHKHAKDNQSNILNPPVDNFAYWMCFAPGVASTLKSQFSSVASLCKVQPVDVEGTLVALKALSNAIKDVPSSTAKNTVKRLVDILSIRNTLFVGTDGKLAFKTPPSADYEPLDTARRGVLPQTLGATEWTADAGAVLKLRARSEIPTSPFAAVTSGLKSFLSDECAALAGDAAAKAGKSSNVSAICGG